MNANTQDCRQPISAGHATLSIGQLKSIYIIITSFRQMANLSILHASNVSATVSISLWESRALCFRRISRSKLYSVGANLMPLIQYLHSYDAKINKNFDNSNDDSV